MKSIRILLFTVLFVTIIVSSFAPKTNAYTLKTTYTVEIRENGTASWVIEQSAYLQTNDDRTSFEELIGRADIDQFSSEVATIINQAHISTGRFMAAENVAVVGNITESGVGAYGFLDYIFDWTNFASAGNTSIAVGDAFSNESFLFGDGELSILLPTGYSVKSCSPSPDYASNGLLRWSTVSDLQDGQPAILLSQTPAGGTSILTSFPVVLGVMLTIIGALLASVLVLRVRKKNDESSLKKVSDETVKEVGDTEKILVLLKKGGGQALQSRITEQLEFSKAKTSKILGDMEKKGIIKRCKNGRDKVVSIPKETEKTKS